MDKRVIAHAIEDDQLIVQNKKERKIFCTFDQKIMLVLGETRQWEKLQTQGVTIPPEAQRVTDRKDELRLMREKVMEVVRAQNMIIDELDSDESKDLFLDIEKELERSIQAGREQLSWKNSLDDVTKWVVKAMNECSKITKLISDYKKNNTSIQKKCN